MGRNSTTSATNVRQFRKLLSNAEVASRDPWDLPSVFFATRRRDRSSRLESVSGYWKYNDDERTAIRSGESSSSTAIFPSYIGIRETQEFYLNDGTKTDWVLHEYCHVDDDDRPGRKPSLFLQEKVVICKVFKKHTTHETQRRPKLFEFEENPFWFEDFFQLKESSDVDDVRTIHQCIQLQNEVDSLLESAAAINPIVHWDTHAESDDDVWQHFTKIRTKDPDVVYAVCHHCDKVLKADYSKKHCIYQLENHRKSDKCRSSCSNPSTDEDREMLHRLRAALDHYGQQRMEGELECQEVNAHLTQLNPCDLGHNHNPSWYVTTSLNRQTNEGCWEEIGKEFTAIRTEQQQMQGFWMEIGKGITTAIQNDYQMQMQVPQYMGLRRTLEFHLSQNGNKLKTGWIMLEYQQVDGIESPALFLQGDMVIRKVFHYDKNAVSAIFSDFDRSLNGDNDNVERYNGKGVNPEITTSTDYMNGGGDRKRKRSAASKRTSKVWVQFTEIRTADPDVVYAVCHHCDRAYSSGRSTNGTSHLWRHNKRCASKLPGTGNTNEATTEWEEEIWPLFLVLKNYGETEYQASGMC